MAISQALLQKADDTTTVPAPTVAHVQVMVRSTATVVLALIAVVVFLNWAQAVFIPITLSVFLSYALTPVVNGLKRHLKLPKAVGAAATLAIILGAIGWGLSSLQPEALNVLDIVPRAAAKFSLAMRGNSHAPGGAVEKMEKAATEIERAANSATTTTATTSTTSPTKRTATPQSETAAGGSSFRLRDYVLMGTASILAGIGQLVVVVALVYFLLVAGDSFRRTLIRISGDSLSKKKITLQILDEIDMQIQRYLFVQIASSTVLALVAWIAFGWIGLENAFFWACFGGIVHLIPYVGPTALVAITALVAYVQFETLQPVATVIGVTLALVGVIGFLLVPGSRNGLDGSTPWLSLWRCYSGDGYGAYGACSSACQS